MTQVRIQAEQVVPEGSPSDYVGQITFSPISDIMPHYEQPAEKVWATFAPGEADKIVDLAALTPYAITISGPGVDNTLVALIPTSDTVVEFSSLKAVRPQTVRPEHVTEALYPATVRALGSSGGGPLPDISWSDVSGKPTTFTPSTHTHSIENVTGLQAALDDKQDSGSYAPASHTHSIGNVTGLQAALDEKQASGSYAPSTHTHSIGNVTGLQAALDEKQASGSYASASHTHEVSDVSGLQAALDGKQDSGSYAPASHTHSIGNVTGLQAALDGKQASGSYAPASHTHEISDVSGLQAIIADLTARLEALETPA